MKNFFKKVPVNTFLKADSRLTRHLNARDLVALGIGAGSVVILIIDYINDINGHMNSLLDHVHGMINKYNCFINIFKGIFPSNLLPLVY